MAKKIPFRISARTARLIGRQNFPNAEGAIIELVKNSYDADASQCIILFNNKYVVIPKNLTKSEFHQFSNEEHLIPKYYQLDEFNHRYDYFEPKTSSQGEDKSKKEKAILMNFFLSKCSIHIIDNGEGMTDKIIEDFWMTIGTSNKQIDFITRSGRIKTGEKGIGRFALDKLGDSAEMLTVPAMDKYPDIGPNTAFMWQIDWSRFDGEAKTLGEIEADLIEETLPDFSEYVKNSLPPQAQTCLELSLDAFKTGTTIEITNLRDEWDDYAVKKLFKNLEVLIPPREERIFDIFLFSTLKPTEYGQISPTICDDYDYKIEARVDEHGKAKIIIHRNEFDFTKFPDKVFELFSQGTTQKENFTKNSFRRSQIIVERSIEELVPGAKNVDEKAVLRDIGAFGFTFYFMKNTATKRNREIFFSREFNSGRRKKWFDQFGGIKLFRDNFRVRPYGEVGNPAFDWLQLGERATSSPSSIGQKGRGPWRVRPNQVSGVINISRLGNINFEDTSSRYGLQENPAFNYFIEVIKGILDIFERDRTHIGQALKSYYVTSHQKEVSPEKKSDVKARVEKLKSKSKKTQAEQDALTLLVVTENLDEQIEELESETKLLRALASSGLVVASFTHELENIKDNLVYRVDEVRKQFQTLVNPEKTKMLPSFINPFIMLDNIKHDDKKLKEWLHYSLEVLRKDKRRRKNIDLVEYFNNYKKIWQMACDERAIQFDVYLPKTDELKIRAFEIDLDSIFNNLLINSFEAFLRKDAPLNRLIKINLEVHDPDVHFIYTDSGPGISKDIVDPEQIFEPLFTTKKDSHTGENTGTGLGMWLVKTLVIENNGTLTLLEKNDGFGVNIIFRNKVKSYEEA